MYFSYISTNISHSTDAAQESHDVELEVGKRVDTLAFVWEQGESFLVGEGWDGWPGYRRLWYCWEALRRALKLNN